MPNKKMRKYWQLGFLSLNFFQGLRYFETKNWLDLIWFIWIIWLVWFIPIKKED